MAYLGGQARCQRKRSGSALVRPAKFGQTFSIPA